eukprot:symbB.v1.2.028841.t1/scaffold3093.1/size63743/1
MAADMPNYTDVVDNVNYTNLGCVGTGATISQYQDKMKLANDEECEIKVLRGPTMEAGNEITDPKEMIYKLGDNVTFFSFTMKEFETMVKKTGGTIKRLSGDVRATMFYNWVWAYAMPINVGNAMDAHDNNDENPVLTALTQGVHNGGNHALKEFPKTIRDRVVEYYVSTNSALLPSNLMPEENLGHPDHVQHVMTTNNLRDGEQEEQQNEAQGDDQDGGNDDDNDGDDAMGGKKRKVDN